MCLYQKDLIYFQYQKPRSNVVELKAKTKEQVTFRPWQSVSGQSVIQSVRQSQINIIV